MLESKIFKTPILENNELYIINVDREDKDYLYSLFDKHIKIICEDEESAEEDTIEIVKEEVKKFFSFINKELETLENDEIYILKDMKKRFNLNIKYMGFIAEFFAHLFVREFLDFDMECVILNLEEDTAMKKGFDGFYVDQDDNEWIMESKSGTHLSQNSCHLPKIEKAYNGIVGLLTKTGDSVNNPWRNAYAHSKYVGRDKSKDLRKRLRILKNNFTNGNYEDIKNYNIMPVSTVYFFNSQSVSRDYLKEKIENDFKNKDYNNFKILCFDSYFYQLFLEYLSYEEI
jgi:hypothetical protein